MRRRRSYHTHIDVVLIFFAAVVILSILGNAGAILIGIGGVVISASGKGEEHHGCQ